MNKWCHMVTPLMLSVLLLLSGCTKEPYESSIIKDPQSSETQISPRPSEGIVDQIGEVSTVNIEAVNGRTIQEDRYWCHIEDEDGIYLMISPETTLYSFKFVSVEVDETEAGIQYSIGNELYSVDKITPEKPFLVRIQIAGLLPTYGIIFKDQNNDERFYTINMKGTDTSEAHPYYLQEIEVID